MDSGCIAHLKVKGQDGLERSYPLADGRSYRAGRVENADIVLDDSGISRLHAMFTVSSTGVVVSDLSSTNGTFVNGKKITIPVDLQTGDVVDIGSFKCSVSLVGNEIGMGGGRAAAGRTMTAQLRPSTAVALVARLTGYSAAGMDCADPSLAKLKQSWLSEVSKAVEAEGGAVDKTLDDSIVAVWYGMEASKVAGQALTASRAIVQMTEQYNTPARWAAAKTAPLACVTAVNSGMALVGSVGPGAGSRRFAVLGDTINVALKMADAGAQNVEKLLISDAVASVLGAVVAVKKLATIVNDSTGESISVYALS